MLKQFKYAARTKGSLRLTAGLAMILLNIVFGLLGRANAYNLAGEIVGVTVCSIAFCVWGCIAIIADYEIIKELYAAPRGYYMILAPVKAWKQVGGRVLAILVWDVVFFWAGVFGIVYQSFILGDVSSSVIFDEFSNIQAGHIIYVICTFLNYLLLILFIFFAAALAKSVLYSVKARGFLAVLGAIGLYYILSFLDILLALAAPVQRYGVYFHVYLTTKNLPAVLIYLVVMIIKVAVFFTATAYLTERKINI